MLEITGIVRGAELSVVNSILEPEEGVGIALEPVPTPALEFAGTIGVKEPVPAMTEEYIIASETVRAPVPAIEALYDGVGIAVVPTVVLMDCTGKEEGSVSSGSPVPDVPVLDSIEKEELTSTVGTVLEAVSRGGVNFEATLVPGQTVTLAVGTGNDRDGLDDFENDPRRPASSLLNENVSVSVTDNVELEFTPGGRELTEGCSVPEIDVKLAELGGMEKLAEGCKEYPTCSVVLSPSVPGGAVEFNCAIDAVPAIVGAVLGSVMFGLLVRLKLPERFLSELLKSKGVVVSEALRPVVVKLGGIVAVEFREVEMIPVALSVVITAIPLITVRLRAPDVLIMVPAIVDDVLVLGIGIELGIEEDTFADGEITPLVAVVDLVVVSLAVEKFKAPVVAETSDTFAEPETLKPGPGVGLGGTAIEEFPEGKITPLSSVLDAVEALPDEVMLSPPSAGVPDEAIVTFGDDAASIELVNEMMLVPDAPVELIEVRPLEIVLTSLPAVLIVDDVTLVVTTTVTSDVI